MGLPARVRVVRQAQVPQGPTRQRTLALAGADREVLEEMLDTPGCSVALALAGSTLVGCAARTGQELVVAVALEWRKRGIEEQLLAAVRPVGDPAGR
ncbi:MAG TPA: hypothetical protein VHN99_09055 [Deinococcales bacterium]|nr:hypothetical protein [Deinococcales bacterium]